MRNFIPYGKQWIDDTDVEAVNQALRSNNLTQGPCIEKFEEAIRNITGAKYCVVVSNATQGLHMAVAALELDEKSEGITTPITFVATANCLITNNLIPIFADIDPDTYNISPKDVERKITSKTKVLIPVDFAGQAVDIDSIKHLAEKYNLFIVEDAAHAIGSNYIDGKPIGCCHKSDITVFSFHPVKTITSGEGGAITTNNESIHKKLIKLRTIGITKDEKELTNIPGPWYYEMQLLSGNNRMTDIQAALGCSQLLKLEKFKKRRKEIVNRYNRSFQNVKNIKIPHEKKGLNSCFHLYVLLIEFEKINKSRKQFMNELAQKRIGTQVHYIPVNSQPYYINKYGSYVPENFPMTESYYNRCLSIPLYPMMSDDEVDYIIETILKL